MAGSIAKNSTMNYSKTGKGSMKIDKGNTLRKPLTYISLFSSAGVGCFGFKMEGFECIASNELIERRLNVQKCNKKCKYDSGYILGDIFEPEIKKRLFDEIGMWREKEHLLDVDVVIATPPCQGMSVANHKKTSHEIIRNSLIVESIRVISEITPKVFIFENVSLFMKTICTDTDGVERSIGEAIERNLGNRYSIFSKVLNLKDYGACSSRTRTLVIAVRKDWADIVSPIELFPSCLPERTLRQVIGGMKPLTDFGEIDTTDIYHSFRTYPEHMRAWLLDLPEGQSAFDNIDEKCIPHQIVNGKIVYNQRKNGDKYRRQIWDKVGPCVHTRNDQLASQNTIHPSDDRVFSIRELMTMMTVPFDFKWVETPFEELNALTVQEKRRFLKNEEINIRQSLGEAVPTEIFRGIASNIKYFLRKKNISDGMIFSYIDEYRLTDTSRLVEYIKRNPSDLGFSSLCRLVELANSRRTEQEAYFTNKSLITEIVKAIPDMDGDSLRILEPSVGAGSFLPILTKLFENRKKVTVKAIDIDPDALIALRVLVQHLNIPSNFEIEYICADFLLYSLDCDYDLVIGNPPFSKSTKNSLLVEYRKQAVNKNAVNTSAFFLEKAMRYGKYVVFIMPKFLLNTPEFKITRELLSNIQIDAIFDFGEKGFSGVLIETIGICVNVKGKPANTLVISFSENLKIVQRQGYICDKKFPYWLIYRNKKFDELSNRIRFGVFSVFRDRQITNRMIKKKDGIRIIKSRNIADDGSTIIDIDGYDAFIEPEIAKGLSVYKFLHDDNVYLAPNMTYKPRVIRKPKGVLTNGSVAILSLNESEPPLTDNELAFFSSDEYREFYRIARNHQTRSLNIDADAVYFYGRIIY